MNISRFEPWNLVSLLQHDMSSDSLGRRARTTTRNDENDVSNWVPSVDILEEEGRFVLRADVPGVKAADINIEMDKGVLSVSGNRPAENLDASKSVQKLERVNGKFSRRFTLPDTADFESISAMCADGILEVVIPKLPEIQARRIAVKAA